jgi:hypothetical protein
MVYQNGFITVVKYNGKILREHVERRVSNESGLTKESCVTLPFGSEYSLLMKNLDSRRASVEVSIDGEDVLFGKKLIVAPNSEIELERFVENVSKGNRFKFIQKTEKIANHRGDRIDDGLIRVGVRYEKVIPNTYYYPVFTHHHHYHDNWGWRGSSFGGSVYNVSDSSVLLKSSLGNEPQMCSFAHTEPIEVQADEGITVKGSESHQQFSEVWCSVLEDVASITIIKLRGVSSMGVKIDSPLTVKTKVECPTCGTKSKSSVKFCTECGTSLI